MPYPVLSHARISGDFWGMDDMIKIPDMLNVMNQRDGNGDFIPFGQITWVTCSQSRNTGGEKITLESAVLVGGPSSKDYKYNPNHHANYTRNIRATDSDRIMKINVLLVTRFMGLKTIL